MHMQITCLEECLLVTGSEQKQKAQQSPVTACTNAKRKAYLDSCHEIQGIFGNGQLALHSCHQQLDSQACCPADRR